MDLWLLMHALVVIYLSVRLTHCVCVCVTEFIISVLQACPCCKESELRFVPLVDHYLHPIAHQIFGSSFSKLCTYHLHLAIMTTETFKTTPVLSDDTCMEKASFFSNASSLTIVHCWLPLMLPAGNGEEISTPPKSSFSVQMQTRCEDQLYISWIVIPRL